MSLASSGAPHPPGPPDPHHAHVSSAGEPDTHPSADDLAQPRRSFLERCGWGALFAGLAAGYGMFAKLAVLYLYRTKDTSKGWMFVSDLAAFKLGDSLAYQAPTGQTIRIARLGNTGEVADFVALSSVCPHLGCQVHWETVNSQFFCPCHNGAFDSSGQPLSGPPKTANQSLAPYPLRIEKGLLYIEVPLEQLS